MTKLRAATAEAHRRLERDLNLVDTPPGRARFVTLLERFHGFHAAWEPLVALRVNDPAFFEPRQRLGHLTHDLMALGRSAEQISALPTYPYAAALTVSREATIGSLYVLEGSTLGGKFIARHLQQADWLPDGGLTYFDPYGSETGAMWQQFRKRAESLSSPDCDAAIEQGAIATFTGLHAWLKPAFATAS